MFRAVLVALALSLALAPPPSIEVEVAPVEPSPSEPPPPSIEFAPSEPETVEPEPELVPLVLPEPSGEPSPSEPPPEWTLDEPGFEELPLAPTAARKSATRRGNDVLMRPFRKPTYAVAAVARLGALVGGQREIIQPIAWGLAMQLRLHFVRVARARFGVELHAGHTRWQQRDEFELVEGDGGKLTRISMLTHTDVSLGPAFEIPIGPVAVQLGGSGGFAVSTLGRAVSADTADDQRISEFDGLVRGGAALGVPIANNQGLVFGAAVHHVFSKREVPVDPLGVPEGRSAKPFGTWVESFVGYQVWF